MRAVVQRVTQASVIVDGAVVGEIGVGLAVLVGIGPEDTSAEAETLAAKLVGLRIFADDAGKMNRSVIDVGGSVLVVSQFTLYGDVRRGRRPSFVDAAPPEIAEPLVRCVAEAIETSGVGVAMGVFGATMEVGLVNDGPVTLLLDVVGGRIL